MNNKLVCLIITLCLSIGLPLYADNVEPNDPNAMFDLAIRYYNGDGVKKNYAETFKWFRKAAYKGDTDAMYNLAVCYDDGIGVEKNHAEAVRWWQRAADRGCADAMYKLGGRYRSGYGVDKSIPKSIEWYQKAAKYYKAAADRGDSDAMYKLGRCYFKGLGVLKSKREAIKLYEKASECGNTDAMYALAMYSEDREGLCRDLLEPGLDAMYKYVICRRDWLREAAQRGHLDAMYEYGIKLYNSAVTMRNASLVSFGTPGSGAFGGTSSDFSEAIEWIRKAAKLGHEDAKRTLHSLERKARARRSCFDGFDGEL